MMRFGFILSFLLINLMCLGQLTLPNNLNFKTLKFLNKDKIPSVYDFATSEKKAFLFYDIKTESLAEVMYNGSEFVYDKTPISVFPIFFTGELKKKPTADFPSKIPTQLYRTPTKSDFKQFNISENDLPFFVVYDEQNVLCGIAKNTEQINEIDCGENKIQSHFLRLKLLIQGDDKSQKPYANKLVCIIGTAKNDTIAKVTTNKYGDFEGELPNLQQDYLVRISEKDPSIKFALLSSQSGKLIGNFTASEGGFIYKILKVDLLKMPDIVAEEDIELKFRNKISQSASEFDVTENLFYELGKNKLTDQSKQTLGKIVTILNEYKNFNLDVISHTDSQGDNVKNLKLATQRSESVTSFLIKNGVDKSRLKAIGKGESEIRNRCVDNVDCSDKEHEYNRRTEFKFSKK